jgi:hypothetical protein
VVQTEARGETGAWMEGMVGEKGILPERSEWFRSSTIVLTLRGLILRQFCRRGRATQQGGCVRQHPVCAVQALWDVAGTVEPRRAPAGAKVRRRASASVGRPRALVALSSHGRTRTMAGDNARLSCAPCPDAQRRGPRRTVGAGEG